MMSKIRRRRTHSGLVSQATTLQAFKGTVLDTLNQRSLPTIIVIEESRDLLYPGCRIVEGCVMNRA